MEGTALCRPICGYRHKSESQMKPVICDLKGLALCNISKHILDVRQVCFVLGFSNLQEYYLPAYENHYSPNIFLTENENTKDVLQ